LTGWQERRKVRRRHDNLARRRALRDVRSLGHGSQRGLELSWPMVGGTRAFPSDELRISVPAEALDSHTTVVAIDFTALE
jgi:hypothetical protein